MTIASYPNEELKRRNREYMDELNRRRYSDYSYIEKGSNFLNDFLYSLGGQVGGGVPNSMSSDPFAGIFQKPSQRANDSYGFMTPCEKCRASQDFSVMNIADPCRGVC